MKPMTAAANLILVASLLSVGNLAAQGTEWKSLSGSAALTSAAPSPAIVDSPLVRAAKASKHASIKGTPVITNDNLVRIGGHFTTTASQQPIAPVLATSGESEEQWLANRRRKAMEEASATAAAKKLIQQKKLEAARTQAVIEGDAPEMFPLEPPALEGPIQPMAPVTPTGMNTQPPPAPKPNPPL